MRTGWKFTQRQRYNRRVDTLSPLYSPDFRVCVYIYICICIWVILLLAYIWPYIIGLFTSFTTTYDIITFILSQYIPNDFHHRHSAYKRHRGFKKKKKQYCFYITHGSVRDIFSRRFIFVCFLTPQRQLLYKSGVAPHVRKHKYFGLHSHKLQVYEYTIFIIYLPVTLQFY